MNNNWDNIFNSFQEFHIRFIEEKITKIKTTTTRRFFELFPFYFCFGTRSIFLIYFVVRLFYVCVSFKFEFSVQSKFRSSKYTFRNIKSNKERNWRRQNKHQTTIQQQQQQQNATDMPNNIVLTILQYIFIAALIFCFAAFSLISRVIFLWVRNGSLSFNIIRSPHPKLSIYYYQLSFVASPDFLFFVVYPSFFFGLLSWLFILYYVQFRCCEYRYLDFSF